MKKILFFLCLLLLAASCATQKNLTPTPSPKAKGVEQPPVYYTGMDEPAASSLRTVEQNNEQ
jgi:uncharacterized lipoprotein YajG